MGTLISQVEYGWTNGSQPTLVGDGDDKKSVVSIKDFQSALSSAENALQQIVTQHNAALFSQEDTITSNVPTALDPGTATASDCATAINSIITILTNLNTKPK